MSRSISPWRISHSPSRDKTSSSTFNIGTQTHDCCYNCGYMWEVSFYFKKKPGVPKLTDSGLMDIVISGEAPTATVVLVSADKDRSSMFKVQDVHVEVDALKFIIWDSKH